MEFPVLSITLKNNILSCNAHHLYNPNYFVLIHHQSFLFSIIQYDAVVSDKPYLKSTWTWQSQMSAPDMVNHLSINKLKKDHAPSTPDVECPVLDLGFSISYIHIESRSPNGTPWVTNQVWRLVDVIGICCSSETSRLWTGVLPKEQRLFAECSTGEGVWDRRCRSTLGVRSCSRLTKIVAIRGSTCRHAQNKRLLNNWTNI